MNIKKLLTTLITIAVVVVAGYVAWIYILQPLLVKLLMMLGSNLANQLGALQLPKLPIPGLGGCAPAPAPGELLK